MNDCRNSVSVIKMSALQGLVCTFLLIISLLTGSYGSPVECCDAEIGWKNGTSKCNDGNRINLNCALGQYIIDPIHDPYGHFYVDSSDDLIFTNYNEHFPPENASHSFCQTHVEDELRYIICFPDKPIQSISWKNIIFGICSFVSSFSAALTLIVYLMLPDLRELQDKAMMSLCASLTMAFLILGIVRFDVFTGIMNDSACIFIALFMYYFLLTSFFWMNVISLNIWKTVWFSSSTVSSNKFFVFYCFFGWIVPIGFLTFAIVSHFFNVFYIKPGFNEVSCWFNGDSATWLYFYGPVMALIIMNFIYLGSTVWKLWHVYSELKSCNVNVLRVKCTMCLKLSIIMGATWIFEIIDFYFKYSSSNIRYLSIFTDLLNSLQGLFIFIILVILRDKVNILLANRKLCNLPFPRSWAGYEDIEKWDENEIDELRLSLKLY